MKIKIWDFPTRLFHWSLVGVYIAALFTSRNESLLEYHTAAGYLAIGLVGFRVLWGLTGNRYARFSDFVRGWGEVRSFLSKAAQFKLPRYLGHNPAVGWAVLLILGATVTIAFTGIITYGGEENRGVWAGVFPFGVALIARAIHAWLAYFIVAAIVLHICAALVHDFILKENIILSMITGSKEDAESWGERVSHQRPEEGRSVARLVVYIIVVVACGIGIFYLPPEGRSDPSSIQQPKVLDVKGFAVRVAPDKAWAKECADCHGVFHPTLLPAASWKRIMAGLDDHFGESVPLDGQVKGEIEAFLVSAAAERSTTEASKKMLYSIDGATPVLTRITDVPYWRDKHSDIKEEVFKRPKVVSKSNCAACHPWAESGSFEDRDIQIPD